MDSDIQSKSETAQSIAVYFASWGKICGYFASCQTKVVKVVTWQV